MCRGSTWNALHGDVCVRVLCGLSVALLAPASYPALRRPHLRFAGSPPSFAHPPSVAGPPSLISSPMRPSSNTFETDPAVNTKIIHLESSPEHDFSLEPRVTLSELRAVFGRCQPYPVHQYCTASISMLRCHPLHRPPPHLVYLSQVLEFPSLLGAQPPSLVPHNQVQHLRVSSLSTTSQFRPT